MENKISIAGCIIYDNDGRILLLHRNSPSRVQWETPGGKIDEGEIDEETAVREVKEELGVDIAIVDRIGQKEFKEDDFVMNYVWFEAVITSGIPMPVEDKFDEVRYFSKSDLKKHWSELSANTKNVAEHLK